MKCQILFSGENKKKSSICHLLNMPSGKGQISKTEILTLLYSLIRVVTIFLALLNVDLVLFTSF